jgi:hypothetical protein
MSVNNFFLHDLNRREQITLPLHIELEKLDEKYAGPFVKTMLKIILFSYLPYQYTLFYK